MRSLVRTQWGHKCGVRQTGTAGGGHQGHILRSFTELSCEFSCACRWCSASGGLPRQGGQAADRAPGPSLHSLALWAAQQTHSADLLNTFSGSSWRLNQAQIVCNPPTAMRRVNHKAKGWQWGNAGEPWWALVGGALRKQQWGGGSRGHVTSSLSSHLPPQPPSLSCICLIFPTKTCFAHSVPSAWNVLP